MSIQTVIALLIRHGVGALGGAGLMTGNQIEMAAGAVAVLGSVAWSVYQKRGAQ